MEPRRKITLGVRLVAVALVGLVVLLAAAASCGGDEWEYTPPPRTAESRPTAPATPTPTSRAHAPTLHGECPYEYQRSGKSFTFSTFILSSDEFYGTSPDKRPEAARQKAVERHCGDLVRRSEPEEAVIAGQREAGLHCMSGWDGNYDALEDLVRPQLFDPGSMDTVLTEVAPVNEDGKHPVTMDFTATDAYGNTVRMTAFGLADNKTCGAELLWIQ
ncbi:hypothetical protein [Candidatus Poriferisocius sp.]|uniref:hypothetical protein n=1 Tax=Candidatus Poriferisocius sp. TaxID=3101276 RepID=UPI003B0254EA